MTTLTNHLPTNIARVGLASAGFVAAAALTSAPLGLALLAGVVHTVAFGALLYYLTTSGQRNEILALSSIAQAGSRIALFFALGIISSNPVTTCYGIIAFTACLNISSIVNFRKARPGEQTPKIDDFSHLPDVRYKLTSA
jgi:hypothetical protein